MKRIYLILLICSILFLSFVFYVMYSLITSSSEKDLLVKVYYIGGIVSGFFAFGAFIVAIWTNYTQNKNGKLQRFENTFFNMLDLQQQITKDLIYNENISEYDNNPKYKTICGRELFQYFWDSLKLKSLSNSKNSEEDYGFNDTLALYRNGLKSIIDDFGKAEYRYQKVTSYFDHYFRHLYTIIKFIHNTDCLTYDEKYKYTSITRATLSRYELVWIYYNCLYGAGLEKFKPLVEKYSLLKNIRPDLLALAIENKKILLEKGKYQSFKKQYFCTDYLFNLTLEKGNNDKYNISAFYTQEELDNGKKLLKDWESFLKSEDGKAC